MLYDLVTMRYCYNMLQSHGIRMGQTGAAMPMWLDLRAWQNKQIELHHFSCQWMQLHGLAEAHAILIVK